jgi:hypothetical protein
MAKSYREEFIDGPKREFTRASAEEALLDGPASGGAGAGVPTFEGRSPLEKFENLIPAIPSTESDLASYELAEASSVMLVFQWLPVEKGAVPSKSGSGTRLEIRRERLNLGYELKEGSNTYEWVYESTMRYDDGRLVDEYANLSHSAEASDPRVQELMGAPGTTGPDVALERARSRIQLLDAAKKECPSLCAMSEEPVELSAFLNQLRTMIESWYYSGGGGDRIPLGIPEPGEKDLIFKILTLDTESQRKCLQAMMEKTRPKIAAGPLSIRFHVNRPLPAESADNQEILPRGQDLDDVKDKLREIEGKAATDLQLIIRGYADKQGTPERNEKLSLDRAEWVKRQIEAASLSKIKHIAVGGYGDKYSPDSPPDDQRFRVAVVEVLPLSQKK